MTFSTTDLRCEYRINPMGVDTPRPRLSWLVTSDRRADFQFAYQVLVASSPTLLAQGVGDRWDSGKILSRQTRQIEYAGAPLASRDLCYWKVLSWDRDNQPSNRSTPATWTMALAPEDWRARWIGLDQQVDDDTPATPEYLRSEFVITKTVRRATIHATALGLYELRLNGRRVSDQLLAPEWTNYHKRVQVQTHDVTPLLQPGPNALGAVLGNGWYAGHWQHWGPKLKRIYGRSPLLLAQLEIEFDDGSVQTLCTDETWRGSTDGPLRFSGIYEGETYDATRDLGAWDEAGYDDVGWSRVKTPSPKVGKLVWQRSEPIRITQELPAIRLTEPRPGVYVFDLGQNITGWCRLRQNEARGTQLTLEHNEVLNPDGTVYMDNLHAGHLSTGDRQIVRYTCAATPGETYEPRFTFQGFRYVQVTGLTRAPSLDLITGCVLHNDFARTGEFTCSDKRLNRLAQNIQWSQRGNFVGVPTDCPQRDERCGYTGDAQFFMPTSVLNFDVAAFFGKWLVDVCQDSQRADHGFGDHAPDYGKGGSQNVGWADAGVICPHVLYRTHADTRVVTEHYDAMKRYVRMLIDTANPDHTRGPEIVGNGDWLCLGTAVPKEVIGTTYYHHVLRAMAEMAQAIGRPDDATDYARRAGEVFRAFVDRFIDADGRILGDTQTGYALAFTMGLVPADRAKQVAGRFVESIERAGGSLTTGFIGTPRLLPALHLAGRDDVAYKLLLRDTMPSWLFPVTQGATTIWERWDGWTPEAGYADSGMNSFNHYTFGSVGQYLFETIAGITPASPGYDTIRIEPVPGPGLTHAGASFEGPHGRISCHWKIDGAIFNVKVTIPTNTTARIVLPTTAPSSVTESGRSLDHAEGITRHGIVDGKVSLYAASGTFEFSCALNSGRS